MNKVFFVNILTLAFASFGSVTASADESFVTRVALRPAIELESSKTEITLSDLVVAKGLSRTALERFKSVRLADAPKAGESRVFSEDILQAALAPELKAVESETGERFELKLPSRVSVTKKKFRLGKSEIEKELLNQFRTQCGDCEFEISNLSVPLISDKMTESTQWVIRSRPEIPKGSFSLPIEITAGSQPTRSYWVTGVVAVRRPVPVAAREISMGERIQADDLVTQMKDVTYTNDVPVSPSELSSGVASRQIAAGQIVFRSAVRKELAIKNGDVVKVSAGSEEWQISMDGIAQTSGYIGDSIRVKIPRTQKLISGLLKEKGVVEVQ